MRTITLYRYLREGGGTTVSPEKPDVEYATLYRLVADEGKAITNGEIITECIDVNSTDGWEDCEKPEEPDHEIHPHNHSDSMEANK